MNTIQVGDRLPNLRLPRSDGTTVRPLRGPHRDAAVVVALHDTGCDPCRHYLRSLADAESRFRLWDGSIRAVTDTDSDAEAGARALQDELGSAVDILVDTDRELLDRVDATAGPVTLVADRYGQVFHIAESGEEHAVMEPRELEEWLQYLATQCPE